MANRRSVSRAFVGVLALVFMTAASVAGRQPYGIQRVAWLQGCWEMISGPRTIEEHWMAPRGDSMIGMGRTVRDGKLVDYEIVILREQGDQLAYDAHPSGQSSAVFISRTVSDSLVVFENPGHDFPRTIGYQRESPDSVLAWIEGIDGGQTRRIDFRYRRAVCPGSR